MNSISHFRRQQTRRQKERRINPFPFNSQGWQDFMQENFQLWPKQDRRTNERRSLERRRLDRRNRHRKSAEFGTRQRKHANFSKDILLEEERKMIMELFGED